MPEYTYLIVGGGMAADAAVKGIRQVDSSGTIGVITSERHPPYDRPPLSKALWKGEPLLIFTPRAMSRTFSIPPWAHAPGSSTKTTRT